MAFLLRYSCMWYDSEEWVKTYRVSKLWSLVAIRLYQDFDMLSPSGVAESLGMIAGDVTAYLGFMQCIVQKLFKVWTESVWK